MTARSTLIKKAKRYLASARLLLDAGDYDSAVSRIYYAAFFCAETLLDRTGLSFSSHKGVISAYGQEFAQKERLDPRFHRLLIRAFKKAPASGLPCRDRLGPRRSRRVARGNRIVCSGS